MTARVTFVDPAPIFNDLPARWPGFGGVRMADHPAARPHACPRPAIRHRLYWATFLAIGTAIGVMVRHHVQGLDAQVHREGLSNAAVVSSRDVLLDLVDVETGLRGYLIGGKRDKLQPYHEGLGRVGRHMAQLRAAVGHSAAERANFDGIAEISRGVLVEFANQVAMVESDGPEAGRDRFVAFPTKPGMDRVRSLLFDIQAMEDRKLAASMAALDRQVATTMFLIDLFTVASGFMVVAMISGFISPPAGRDLPAPPVTS